MLHRILALFARRPRRLHCACGALALTYDAHRAYCGPCAIKNVGGVQ